jgi:hypothetical protein
MGVIENHLSNVQRNLNALAIEKIIFDFLKSIQSHLAKTNAERLNNKSQDVFGDPIGFYSRATEIITLGQKKAGEPYDMKDTGEFLSKFYASVSKGIITFGSTDPKTDDILDNPNLLSADLFGLTDGELKDVINQRLLPYFLKQVENTLTQNN